jgi:hypothetical protein
MVQLALKGRKVSKVPLALPALTVRLVPKVRKACRAFPVPLARPV